MKLVLVIGELVLGIFVLMAFTPPLLRPRYPEHTMVALVVVALGVVLFIDGIRRLIRFAKRG